MNISLKHGCYFKNALLEFSANLNVTPEYYIDLKKILEVQKLENCEMIRIGLGNKDGGYIMANDFDSSKIAYSFGICDDVNWDNIMAELGCDIYMYDHTIEGLPYTREEFHYFQEGISGEDEENQPLKTLKYYIDRNGHSNAKNMILKMDVEGAEWDFLETVDLATLKQFDQIILEFHDLIRASSGEKTIELLKKLNNTHQLIHLHPNNTSYLLQIGNTIFADVLEATYVNKDTYQTSRDLDLELPISIDAPNDPNRQEVVLGKWNTSIKF